jgi:hypothetical protein
MRVPPTSTRLADIPEAGRIAARPITRSHSCRWVRYARMPGRRGAMHHDSARRVFRGPAGKASGARSGRLELAGRFPPGANIDAAWATAIHAFAAWSAAPRSCAGRPQAIASGRCDRSP